MGRTTRWRTALTPSQRSCSCSAAMPAIIESSLASILGVCALIGAGAVRPDSVPPNFGHGWREQQPCAACAVPSNRFPRPVQADLRARHQRFDDCRNARIATASEFS